MGGIEFEGSMDMVFLFFFSLHSFLTSPDNAAVAIWLAATLLARQRHRLHNFGDAVTEVLYGWTHYQPGHMALWQPFQNLFLLQEHF